MSITVTADIKAIEALLKNFPVRAKAAIADGLDHATRSFFGKFYQERLQGPPGIRHTRGGIFHRFRRTVMINGERVFLRQGARQQQTTAKIMQSTDNPLKMSIEMYSQSDVADIHEKGGTVSVNEGISTKSMPVPLNEEARKLAKSAGGLRSLILFRINGKLFLGRKGAFGRPQLLFILMRGVRIKPRLGFYMTWDRYAGRRAEILDEALDKALEKSYA